MWDSSVGTDTAPTDIRDLLSPLRRINSGIGGLHGRACILLSSCMWLYVVTYLNASLPDHVHRITEEDKSTDKLVFKI